MEITIGANIKRLRVTKSVTQEQLAEAMNVTPAGVSKWERGETYPDITLLQPLAYYFGVTLDDLMGYDEKKVDQTIEELIAEFWRVYRQDWRAANKLIED
ncbi:MAG: helix-turn-helix transcriptional regulator, partial [Clostridia bacterium]|nr:helix-turn-helix transcriptional regulator [Clostridia bacterium]